MSKAREIAPGVAHLPILFVNVYFVSEPDGSWVLVDAGLPGKAALIRAAAQELFGKGARPAAIVLTHGHFDHAGSVLELAEGWDVPIFAHPLELPYLTGRSDYPPKDPTVGGFIAFASRFMPTKALDLGHRVRPLPPRGALLGLPGWQWIETPGHSPGHVSLFRGSDSTLLGGDALATVNMDSARGMATMKQELARAGAPFVCDWEASRDAVARLAQLKPNLVACGHGTPMSGPDMAAQMDAFAREFSPPSHGRYVNEAARTDEHGVESLPPAPSDPLPKIAAGLGLIGLGVVAARKMRR